MFATARKIEVGVIYLRYNSLAKSSCFTTRLILQPRSQGRQVTNFVNTKVIGICFLGNDSAITGNIFGEVNNRITFQISRPSLKTLLRKFTLPSLDADKSNSAIPLNVSTLAWNCRSASHFSIVSTTSTGFFSTDSDRARKYQGSCTGKVGVHRRHFTDSFLIAGNT